MLENIAELIIEFGSLKLTPRSGWFKIGIKNPESVAEHSFRTALIAYILAKLDGYNSIIASAISFLALLHDAHESRTMDLHRVAKNYVKVDENKVRKETLAPLEIEDLFLELEKMGLDVSKLEEYVKDADKLELLIQAREYSMITPLAKHFEVKKEEIKTDSGKKIFEKLKEVELDWWSQLE